MSYLSDKKPCSLCHALYDFDQLNIDNVCYDCLADADMLDDLNSLADAADEYEYGHGGSND